MKRLLFVNPAFDEYTTGLPQAMRRSASAKWSPIQVGILPLGLATVAALTPDSIEIDFWDEGVQGQITAADVAGKTYDLIGVTGYVNHAGRMIDLGRMFRQLNVLTVVGGPGVSSEPERFRDHFDILFIGEAEYTWPRFLADHAAGTARPEYRQVDKVDMADSPLPKWDGVPVGTYLIGAVQTTRGCPFDCEFCDVIYLFGRTARHKSIERVIEEVAALQRHGMSRILFCDDNFIGNRRYAKDLLRELGAFNRSLRQPVMFLTSLTLNVARDEELLALLADANFTGVFIGIESPNVESLKETNKPQNYTVDMLDAVRTVQGYGILIQSGLIVGFDHDDGTVFDQHFAFVQESGVPVPMINMLKAPTGTKLWTRLLKKGRVFQSEALRSTASVEGLTNVIPERMSLVELLSGYISLVERVRDWNHFEQRMHTLISQFRRRPNVRASFDPRKLLLLLVMLMQMNGAGRRTALRLLLYTLRRAPSMVERVMGAVAFQYQEALRVPTLQRSIAEQIRALEAGEIRLRPEQMRFDVPEGFRRSYPAIFAELYARVREGLEDPSRAEVALVEVTYDFLARWGSSFHEFEEHHRTFLHELCDRTIAAENGTERRLPAGRPAGILPALDNVRIKRLSDEVLRCVEQDLRTLSAHA